MLSKTNKKISKTGVPVRVLIIEDSEDDAELMLRYLRKGGFKPKFQRVESGDSLKRALIKDSFDLILCDHNMPGFDSIKALEIVNEQNLITPFMLISDSFSNGLEATLRQNGAKAAISKSKLEQLVPAVVKELQQAQLKNMQTPNSNPSKVNGVSDLRKRKRKGGKISLFAASNTTQKLKEAGIDEKRDSGGLDSVNEVKKPGREVKNILIVEDELIQSILLEKLIKSLGYKVVGKVTTGADAIEMALKLQPDLITMDISLQDDIDGIMATKSIQKKSMIPVIYISGNSDQYNVQRAEKTNFIDFIPKPVNKESLAKSFSKAEEKRVKES